MGKSSKSSRQDIQDMQDRQPKMIKVYNGTGKSHMEVQEISAYAKRELALKESIQQGKVKERE